MDLEALISKSSGCNFDVVFGGRKIIFILLYCYIGFSGWQPVLSIKSKTAFFLMLILQFKGPILHPSFFLVIIHNTLLVDCFDQSSKHPGFLMPR